MRWIYTLLMYASVPLVLLRLLWRGRKVRGYWHNIPQRFGFVPAVPAAARDTIWVHAVSVGETLAALPLIDALLAQNPQRRIYLTTTTPTGAAIARQRLGERLQLAYLPYDLPDALARFFARVRPAQLLILERELWPNLLAACHRRGVPVFLINARLSAQSARAYARPLVRGLVRAMLMQITHVAAQADEDAARFIRLGAPRVSVTGNLKYDTEPDARAISAGRAWRGTLGERPVWIAASTHAGEEVIVLDAHDRIRRKFPDSLLILVPRHPERAAVLARYLAGKNWQFARRSGHTDLTAAHAVYLVDTLGELILFYAAADVAFVGGSLVAVGGHNLLEPAALAVPVICGKYTHNFADVFTQLHAVNAVTRVSDAITLADAVLALLQYPRARQAQAAAALQAVSGQRGAVQRTMALLR